MVTYQFSSKKVWVMTRNFSAIAVVIGLCGMWPAGAGAQTAATQPVVMVSGDGLVKVTPDQAWVTLATESRSKNPKEAQSQNAAAMSAVQQKLAAAGLPKDAIRTIAYDLQLESDWVNGRQVPRGYVARNLIEVRLDDITRVGEVVDLAVTSGANSVQGVRFDLKNRQTHEREALRRATADARGRAEAAASGAGTSIDRIVRIEEPGMRPTPPPMPMMMERMAVGAEQRPQTPVIAGEIEIRASVVITATLK
jgi:uncharacterized protein YggE